MFKYNELGLAMAHTFSNRQASLRLRFAEKTLLAFFAALLFASFLLPLPCTSRMILATVNVLVGGLLAVLGNDNLTGRNRAAATLRDWLPALLILLAYRESGLFIKTDPAHRLDHLFIVWDRWLLHSRWVEGVLEACKPWPEHYLELCYLLCYPLVPLGFAALYWARPSVASERGLGGKSCEVKIPHPQATLEPMFDRFWTTVVLATLFCYAIYPVFPLTPPRLLFNDIPGPPVPPLLRHVNLWILNRLSVQVCVFPSAHAASVTATALAVRAYMPRLGILFCIGALSVAAATVYGRYHYTADAIAGVLVGIAAFVASSRIHKA